MPEKVEKAWKDYQSALQQYGDDQATAVREAYDVWQKAQQDAETARSEGVAQVRQGVVNYLNEGYNAQDALIKEAEERQKKAEQEDEDLRRMEHRRVSWTGAAELAANLVNMFAVGGLHASNQQYHSYSEDWQKKADRDQRERRMRIDNMRERQRALQQQMIQMKMQGGSQLAQFDAGEVNAKYNNAGRLADAGLQSAKELAGLKAQTGKEVAQAGVQGTTAAVNVRMQERQIAEQAAARRENAAITAARYGLRKNDKGEYEIDPNSVISKATSRASSGGGGSSSINTLYYTNEQGEFVPVYMRTKEYDEFITQSYAKLKDNEDFVKAYRRLSNDTEKKSLIFQFAIQDPERRAILSQYSDSPEAYTPSPVAPQQTPENVPGYARPKNDPTGLGGYQ